MRVGQTSGYSDHGYPCAHIYQLHLQALRGVGNAHNCSSFPGQETRNSPSKSALVYPNSVMTLFFSSNVTSAFG